MLFADLAVGQFQKRLTLIIAVKCDHAEPCVLVFNMITLHCNDQALSSTKLFDCSVCVMHVCYHFLCTTLYIKLKQ